MTPTRAAIMRRTSVILIAALPAVSLSGCPSTGSIAFGVWIFELVESNVTTPGVGLVMFQNGFALDTPNNYPGTNGSFGGSVTWLQDGSAVVITQNAGIVLTGTVQTSTSMRGNFTFTGDPSRFGTWTAVLGP